MAQFQIQFTVKVHDDAETRKKEQFLSRLETALDHSLNNIPKEFYTLDEAISLGDSIKITIEIQNES